MISQIMARGNLPCRFGVQQSSPTDFENERFDPVKVVHPIKRMIQHNTFWYKYKIYKNVVIQVIRRGIMFAQKPK